MRVTIKEIARRAEVAISTASNVLNNKDGRIKASLKTRDKILRVAQELNYSPSIMAKGLREGKTFLVGVAISKVTSGMFSKILQGIEDIFSERHYSSILCTYDSLDELKGKCDILIQKRVDGIIAFPENTPEWMEYYLKLSNNIPLIFAANQRETNDIPFVHVDGYRIGYTGIKYLFEHGHRNIASTVHHDQERVNGSIQAMSELGMAPDLMFEGECSFEFGREVLGKLIRQNMPVSAIFTYDYVAAGIIYEAQKCGIDIPGKLSILGIDNMDISHMTYPRISTVAQPQAEQGAKAAELMLQCINREKLSNIVLEPFIIERESCKLI